MVTFLLGDGPDNLHTLVIGLSHANLKRLKRGQPIKMGEERTAGRFKNVVIFSGRTEDDMAREIKKWTEYDGVGVSADRHGWPGDPQA